MKHRNKAAKSGSSRPTCSRWWSDPDTLEGEVERLVYFVEDDWCWAWPGWKWVADRLNSEFGNGRTPQACRAKYARILSANSELNR